MGDGGDRVAATLSRTPPPPPPPPTDGARRRRGGAQMERVSLDELDGCMRQLNKALGAAAAAGGPPLPRCLVIRLNSTDEAAPGPALPVQLMQLHSGSAWNMKLVKWLTKLEKALTTLATLPLPTVAHLCGDGVIGTLALQVAFACDVRIAQKTATLAPRHSA